VLHLVLIISITLCNHIFPLNRRYYIFSNYLSYYNCSIFIYLFMFQLDYCRIHKSFHHGELEYPEIQDLCLLSINLYAWNFFLPRRGFGNWYYLSHWRRPLPNIWQCLPYLQYLRLFPKGKRLRSVPEHTKDKHSPSVFATDFVSLQWSSPVVL
jgi:hypothetical protein